MDREPLSVNNVFGTGVQLVALEQRLPHMTDDEVRSGLQASIAGGLEADLLPGEMERRDIDG